MTSMKVLYSYLAILKTNKIGFQTGSVAYFVLKNYTPEIRHHLPSVWSIAICFLAACVGAFYAVRVS